MAKSKSIYVCSQCGTTSLKWQGKCSSCNSWNSFDEKPVEIFDNSSSKYSWSLTSSVKTLSEVEAKDVIRISTGLSEFDRALGGGLIIGSVILIGGDPGIGKSTLLLQSLSFLSSQYNVLYVTGEESVEQIALRARRLNLSSDNNLKLLAEINLTQIINIINLHNPLIVVIDSIQTIYSDELHSSPGSLSQVKDCASKLTRVAKEAGIIVFMVGHLTKDGTIAGPRVLEHMVDTVLYFEGDQNSSFRLIRSFKNRFGAVNELGAFAMTDKGLRCVSNPSALFLSNHINQVPGSCIMATQEGSRTLLVEIQALVNKSYSLSTRKILSVGLDSNRLSMVLAILYKHGGFPTFDKDIFVNVVGGVKISEPASDLAVLLAIVSSLLNLPIPLKLFAFGEIGLSGEIRPAIKGQERLKEASKLGFRTALIPTQNAPKEIISDLKIIKVSSVSEVIGVINTFNK
ncbi:DNA repair protein RadA/Sms [Candidatus Kinetoplastibacterium desouzaii TCC079E]|uniref:DNA repair protein RadA n=1 Tax=Candidatus Kinetoplastidibacterium desouzai TCC079E TaxID=1208919 RepID=M1LRI6_9PROT|nr:DNA repair protein RadA [Candidatus Kinetoplastibacterium desouzaii]AGF46746.1 DNA repair protein RadA/Sms [Candidatus Kinetoplastibacterium desouzaii TCC079E]